MLVVFNRRAHLRACAPGPAGELEDYFRPDSAGCCTYYAVTDVKSITETAGTYNGVACSVVEMHFKPKIIDGDEEGQCISLTGPCQVLLYLAADTRRVIAMVHEEWDIEELALVTKAVREYQYNLPLNDDLFTFTPPAGAKAR